MSLPDRLTQENQTNTEMMDVPNELETRSSETTSPPSQVNNKKAKTKLLLDILDA